MRGEFLLIQTAFDHMPRITTTGLFDTVFNQVGSYAFTLPAGPGTIALSSSVDNEITRATSAEGALATALSTEAAARAAAVTAEATARTAAIAAEATRATTAEGANATAALAAAGIGRNRIHNGGFGINQRAQVSGVALGAGAYGHDRWKAGAGGCTYTFTQTQPTTVITITAGTLQQIIEALTVEGGSYTLSWIGTATARINAGSYLASPITVTGLAANTAITVEFNTGTVDRAQLEPGSTASVFARRSLRYELAECQRFYQVGQIVMNGYAGAGATVTHTYPFPVMMRAFPTLTIATVTNLNCGTASGATISPAAADFSTAVTALGQFQFAASFTTSADL